MEVVFFFLEVVQLEALLAGLDLLEQGNRIMWGDEDHGFAHVEGAQCAVDGAVANGVRNLGGIQSWDGVWLIGIGDGQLHSEWSFLKGCEFRSATNISTIKPVQNNSVAHRLIFLAFAGLSLLVGLAAGATLLGLTATPGASFAADHGPLMVFGFVGGAIGLERTVAVRTSWAWAGPVCHVAGVLGILAGLPRAVPAVCFAASFLVLGFIYATIYRRQASLAILVQAAGVIGGVAAAALWAMGPGFAAAMPLCVLYAVATIIGERMELARVTMAGTRAENHLTLLVLGLAAASVIYVLSPAVGYRAMGLVLIATAAATAQVDVAKNLVRSHGLPRYSAACMLAGYGWLALGGYLWLLHGQSTGFAYDASVHAIFLGFVMSMIFAHAPIIFTSAIRRRLPYRPVLYVPVALLHGGLALRILADCAEHTTALRTGGVVTIIAVLVFLACGIVLTGKESRRAHS